MRISDWSSDVCSSDLVRETVARWRAGEAWDTTPLWWMPGQRPKYSELVSFSQELSDAVGRPCVAYGIKDKRERKLDFKFEIGRATCRERVCQYVKISVVVGSLKKKIIKKQKMN